MPPSTDCSAGMSCGGCRSYAGAVAEGRLKSSANATGFLHLLAGAPAPPLRGEAGSSAGAAGPNICSGDCYRRAPTSSRRPAAAGEDVRNPEGSPSITGVHADLHNLWTSRWMEACRHVETAGDTRCSSPRFPVVTCTDGAHRLWTGEKRQQILRAAPRVTRRPVAAACGRLGTTKDGPSGMAGTHRSAVSRPLVTEGGRTATRGSGRRPRAPRGAQGDGAARAVHRRREGRRTGVRRPSRAVPCSSLSWGRPRSAAASRPRGAPARRRCADRWS